MITQRPPTEEERALILKGAGVSGCVGCLVVVAAVLGSALAWTFGSEGGEFGVWLGVGLGVSISAVLGVFFLPSVINSQRARKDALLLVEEIEVVKPRLYEISLISDDEPILVFTIDENRLLHLQGQWLRLPETYGVVTRERKTDANEDRWSETILNGLPAPHSFPSDHFSVLRLPTSGEVLLISVKGRYIRPEKTVDVLQPEYDFGWSQVFVGKVEEIGDVLKREHGKRKGAGSA